MAEDMHFLPRADLLSLEEMDLLCRTFVAKGVTRIRLTGGEPLVRRNVMGLIQSLGGLLGQGLEELTLTTNGTQLTRFADPLAAAGIGRINVSLDSLKADRFAAITRRGDWDQVQQGLVAAQKAGLKIKINMVAMQGVNDDEIPAMVRWCGDRGMDLCLIETMPMGGAGLDISRRFLPLSHVRADLADRFTLLPSTHRTGGPAQYWMVQETGQRLGFITPMSQHFCDSCNRVRVSATGVLYTCLGQDDHAALRDVLRGGDRAALAAAIDAAIAAKPRGHDFAAALAKAPMRHMNVTGG